VALGRELMRWLLHIAVAWARRLRVSRSRGFRLGVNRDSGGAQINGSDWAHFRGIF